MKSKTIFRTILILSLIIINIGCDQITKKLVRENISPNQIISTFNNHLRVTKVENSGAFLSLGNSLSQTTKNILLSLLPALVIGWALYYVLTRQNISHISLWGFCFIIGGGIGNIFDRIAYGSVTDFLHISFGKVQTGIFNMADVSIMTGTFIILAHAFFKRKQPALAEPNNS